MEKLTSFRGISVGAQRVEVRGAKRISVIVISVNVRICVSGSQIVVLLDEPGVFVEKPVAEKTIAHVIL